MEILHVKYRLRTTNFKAVLWQLCLKGHSFFKTYWLNYTCRNCSHKDTREIRLSGGLGGLCGPPLKASQGHENSEWQLPLCSDPQDDLHGTVWPFRMLFSHLSYCETAVKINAVPNIQGQTEITCGRPNEKQAEGVRDFISLFYVFVFCRVGWGRGGEWYCMALWLHRVSSKVYLIVIVAGLGHALNWSRGPILLPSLCLMGFGQGISPPWSLVLVKAGEGFKLDSPQDRDGKQVSS